MSKDKNIVWYLNPKTRKITKETEDKLLSKTYCFKTRKLARDAKVEGGRPYRSDKVSIKIDGEKFEEFSPTEWEKAKYKIDVKSGQVIATSILKERDNFYSLRVNNQIFDSEIEAYKELVRILRETLLR